MVTRTTSFAELGVPAAIVAALEQARIRQPFPIQAETIPDLLAGKDVIGRAPTGSGKTLAFGIPLVAACHATGPARKKRPTALGLAPTRELAAQIADELSPLAHAVDRTILAVYGGVGLKPQIDRLSKGVDLLVATPGRLEDLIQQRVVSLAEVNNVVVDEADRMADMGFLPAVRRLLDQTDPSRQTVLYSATLDGEVAKITRAYQHDPVRHEVGEATPDLTKMEHHFWMLPRAERIRLCASVVATFGRTIVFTRTRHGADRAARQLTNSGVKAVPIHGNRSQAQRQRALDDFATGKAHALVATDVAARGIHVDAVECVVHFDPVDEDSAYVHRSGRTARAGARGVVVSFVDPSQTKAVKAMMRRLDLPQEMTEPPGLEFEPEALGGDPEVSPTGADRNRDRRPTNARQRKPGGPKPSGAASARTRSKSKSKSGAKPGAKNRSGNGSAKNRSGNGGAKNTAKAKRHGSGDTRTDGRPSTSSHKRRSTSGGKRRGGPPPNRRQGRSS